MDINVNQWIPAQFPSKYQGEGPLFIAFIKAYYEYLELEGKPTHVIRSFLDNIDIDKTQDQFVQYFKDEFMADLPNTMVTNQRLLIKHIVDLYRSKGTPRGFELLFRILFNEDIRLYIPGQFVFKPSDNTWVTKNYIEVSDSPYLNDLVGLSIFCSTDQATAMVEEFNVININNKLINILVLSNITGNFNFGSKILSNDLPEITIDNAPLIVGSLSAISLDNGGALFNLGDLVTVEGSGSDGLGVISSIRTENGKVIFKLINGGFGFTLNAQVQVVGGNGTGATFSVGSIVNQETFVINTDVLGSYYNTLLDSNTSGFQLNLSGIVGSFTVGQSVNAQANGVGLDFAYLSGSLANGEILSNTALNIAGLTIVEIDNPNFVNLTGTNANLLNANLVSGVTLHGATSGASIYINSVMPFVDYAANGVVTASNSTSVSVNNFSGYFLPTSKLLGPAGNGTITTTIRKTDWLFPSFNTPDNMDSSLQSVLTYNTMVVGTIASLTAEDPGDGYIANPVVTITEPLIAQLAIDDGVGGIWGNDSIVTATANTAGGVATSVAIINSGYGYSPGESVILQGPGEIAASGVAIVDGTGVSQGFWTSNKSFASDEIFIEDSFYYQPFSYEIIAPRMQSTYEKFVQELVHPVGMVMFGRFYMEDTKPAKMELDGDSVTQV